MNRNFIITGAAVITLVVSIWSLGCSQKTTFENYAFAVDSTTVSAPLLVKDLQLVISPPAGWLVYDSALTEQFRQMLADAAINRKFAPVYPLAIFVDTNTNSMMYVAQVNDNNSSFESMNNKYYEFLKANAGSSALEKKNLDINGLHVGQYLLRSSDVINYKLLGEISEKDRFLIEYIVGARYYKDEETAVESSMGTIHAAEAINQ